MLIFKKTLKVLLVILLVILIILLGFVFWYFSLQLGLYISIGIGSLSTILLGFAIYKFFSKFNLKLQYLTYLILQIGVFLFVLSFMIWVFVFPIRKPELTSRGEYTLVKTRDNFELKLFKRLATDKKTEIPMLFVVGGPGGGITVDELNLFQEFANNGIDTYAYDPLGGGESDLTLDNPQEVYTIQAEVDRLEDVINSFHTDKVILIAHSYGSMVASRYMARPGNKAVKFIAMDTAPLFSFSGNTKVENDEVNKESGDSSTSQVFYIVNSFDFRENLRMNFGTLLTIFTNKLPFGQSWEYGHYFIEIFKDQAVETEKTNPSRCDADPHGVTSIFLNFEATLFINKDVELSPDFSNDLIKNASNVPVLLFHPKCGVIAWRFHRDYEKYFQSGVKIIPVPTNHGVWLNQTGKESIIKNGTAFILDQALPSEVWTSKEDPYP